LLYSFSEYSWGSDTGTTMVVKIQKQILDEQLAHDGTLRLLTNRPAILDCDESRYIDVHGRAPPAALPAP
jgi:hypothetical protein